MRILAMAGGLAGAMTLSQFPEASQQYVQRLSGAVDELRTITVAFDASARLAGMSRDEALQAMSGGGFQESLRDDFRTRITRYERLNADYQALSGAAPLQRLTRFYRIRDPELMRRTWDDYKPAVPLTLEGLLFTAGGYLGGFALVSLLIGLLMRPFRRRLA